MKFITHIILAFAWVHVTVQVAVSANLLPSAALQKSFSKAIFARLESTQTPDEIFSITEEVCQLLINLYFTLHLYVVILCH